MGLAYRSVDGGRAGNAEAFKWLTRAAEQGVAGAQVCLGGMYEDGAGTKPNPARACYWYRLALTGKLQPEDAELARKGVNRVTWHLNSKQLAEVKALCANFAPKIELRAAATPNE